MSFMRQIRRRLRPVKLKAQVYKRTVKHRFKRFFMPPTTLPQNTDGSVLIHLGCGYQNDPRYINVDGEPLPHVHYVGPVEKLPMFRANYADLVYACHVLEHISHQQMINVLSEWRRVLKPGGVVRISVPDFDKLIDLYHTEGGSVERVMSPLMGTQESGYDFHMTIFNEAYLSKLLKEAGFLETRIWDPDTASYYSFHDWARDKKIHGIYPIGLNIEGVK
jgi:predicted SAM-dependent methyltransferase